MMAKLTGTGQIVLRAGLVVMVAVLLSACNLGAQAPSEPIEPGQIPLPQDLGEQGFLTETPQIQLPPTNTPEAELLPAEQLGPITLGGTEHRTQEPVTVRVRRGTAVSNTTCSWVHQDTNQTGALGTPTSTQVDENTFEDVYTFTPQMAGTYAINCSGIALTVSGQRAVSAAGLPFTVEAKG